MTDTIHPPEDAAPDGDAPDDGVLDDGVPDDGLDAQGLHKPFTIVPGQRQIRSFVLRQGRFTEAQQRALSGTFRPRSQESICL